MTVTRSLSYAEARERVLGAVRSGPVERVSLAAARGRALRETLTAPHPLPPFDNASMDGWAVRSADLGRATGAAPVTLTVVEVISAGRVPSRPLGPGEAMRIMTGAMMPQGGNAVVPFEEAEDRVGRERALGEPLADLVDVDGELDRSGPRVVVADRLDGLAVAGAAAVHDDDAVGRLLRGPDASEANSNCHVRAGSS